jgi:hypothetical protein
MKRASWLARLAALIWLAWLGLVGLMLGMLRLRVWHPHYLPVTAALVMMLCAALALFVGGGWRLIRGPGRIDALACWLLGLAPVGFLAGHLMYGFRVAEGRQLELNLPLKALIPFGESTLDLVARYFYPQRTLGKRVVMISAPMSAEAARKQVAAMDRHVQELESRLGRTGKGRVYWVRGPLLGLQGKAIHSMCFGSRPDEEPSDPDGLTVLDRHEVAHVVLNQFRMIERQPPAVLTEGWAEVGSGIDPNALILRALSRRETGQAYTLRELLGREWYSRHEMPAYMQGAALVRCILAKFGPDRFVALYATCRPATFAADCKRILGVSIDQLDQDYWSDIEKQAGPGGYHRLWLASLELGPAVKPPDWTQFISDYLAAAERLLAPYERVRLSVRRTYSDVETNGKTTTQITHSELTRSGALRALRVVLPGREAVYLASPQRSLRAARTEASKVWEVRDEPGLSPAQLYRWMIREIERMEPVVHASVPLLELSISSTTLVNPLSLRLTRLERFREGGRSLIRLEFEGRPPAHPFFRRLALQLSADDYSLVHEERLDQTENLWRVDAVHEWHDGIPLLKSLRRETRRDDGSQAKSELTVSDRSFEPIPEAEFTPERLLGEDPVQHIAAKRRSTEGSAFLRWYPLPLVAGGVSLMVGAGLLPWTRRGEGLS